VRRRAFLFALLAILAGARAFAMGSASLAAGGTLNGSTTTGITGGPALHLFYGFNDSVELGLDSDFTFSSRLYSLDLALSLRWNLPVGPLGGVLEPFLQIGGGAMFPWYFPDDTNHDMSTAVAPWAVIPTNGKENPPWFLAAFTVGAQVMVTSHLYLEASVKGGYPFVAGASVLLGWRFSGGGGDDSGGYYDSSDESWASIWEKGAGGNGEEIYNTIE